ncbi:hypothetical protein IQ62_38110 [Streptomyces scabiei]|nr:hypothetical protein IQ62_38110 [Streptomyces scabiei]
MNIYDPVACIAATMRYVRSRYGVAIDGSDLARPVKQFDPNRPPVRYWRLRYLTARPGKQRRTQAGVRDHPDPCLRRGAPSPRSNSPRPKTCDL